MGLAIPGAKPSAAKPAPAVKTRLPEGLFTAALPDAAKAFLSDWKLKAGRFPHRRGQAGACRRREGRKAHLQPRSGNRASFRRSGQYQSFDPARPWAHVRQPEPQRDIASRPPALLRQHGRADLPLEWLDPPLRASTNLSPSGRLSANLDATITEEKGKGLGIQASGSLTVRDLRLKDARTEKVYAVLRRLSADTFRFSSASSSFEAKEMLLDLLRMDVALNADKTLDILECVPKKQRGQEPSSPFRFSVRP